MKQKTVTSSTTLSTCFTFHTDQFTTKDMILDYHLFIGRTVNSVGLEADTSQKLYMRKTAVVILHLLSKKLVPFT